MLCLNMGPGSCAISLIDLEDASHKDFGYTKSLKLVDFVKWLNYYYFVLLDCFPLFLHFLTSLDKFALWSSGKASVQFSSVTQLCPTPWDPVDCSTPGFPIQHQLPELAQTHVHRVGDAIQPSHPLSSPSPPAFNFSQHQSLFQWVSSSHQVVEVLESQLHGISPSNEYSGPISFRMDWSDSLAAQGTLKSLLQHHSAKASILWHPAFF